jgi:hypothetical protein
MNEYKIMKLKPVIHKNHDHTNLDWKLAQWSGFDQINSTTIYHRIYLHTRV